ncbi:hypothetical protein [uncultured Thiodictyon sp.]|uniref:hypothetical protein n=1 Tax=uncultured Thiodictyon sp. TaxID=1846217 RepID=UPI0025CE2AB9|nr:hypothetical protein [uncultured Thiodictyon sp.]
MTTTLRSLLFTISLALGAMQLAVGAVPRTLTYQGTLTDGAGQAVTGSKTIQFSLYTTETGGTAFWTETQTLTLVAGRLSVLLGGGATNPLDTSKFTGETYIGIKVGTDTEMPRQKFSSVAYAFQAGDGGVPRGGIIMWSGAVDAVPDGWALCNGITRTLPDGSVVTPPDLQDKFIVGAGASYAWKATGGVIGNNISHTHSINGEPLTTSTAPDHTHHLDLNSGLTNGGSDGVDKDGNAPWVVEDHYHNVNGDTWGAGNHNHTIGGHSHGGATGSWGSTQLENRPPYYALAFIMKL